MPTGDPESSTFMPIAARFACTFCARLANGTPLIVRSLGNSSWILPLPRPDAANSDFAFATFWLTRCFCVSDPRNMFGMIPGA